MSVSAPPIILSVRVADEVWIATALLHKENPDRSDFSIGEIVQRVGHQGMAGRLRPGVYVHVVQHCVANRPPNPGRYRMLYETREGHRRLFRYPDAFHFGRDGGKTLPARKDIPAEYHNLLEWYASEYKLSEKDLLEKDPILRLRGLGKEIWKGVDPDEYVRQLREGWE
jgi:hypothetical protein